MTQAVAQRSFSSGEMAPSFWANTNLAKYQAGLRTLRNFILQRGGGIMNRSGTIFCKEVKDSTVQARLVEFSYSFLETYLLEFGNLYIRFYQMGLPLAPVSVTGWSNITLYGIGSFVTYLGITYYALAQNSGAQPNISPATWYPLPDPTIMEIPTPYTTAELMDLQFAQSKNVMTITHPSHVPYELTRPLGGSVDFTMLPILFTPFITPPTAPAVGAGGSAGAITYWAITAFQKETFEESLPALVNAVNKVPSAGAPVALSWTDPVGLGISPVYYNIYRSTDGGTYGFIGKVSSPTIAFSDVGTIADVLHSFPSARDVFNATNKYPAAVTNYQQRRLFANSNNDPETVWASRTAQPTNYGITFPLQDDDAVTFTMIGKRANPVRHMLDLGRLVVLTDREEKMVEGDDAGILRPDAINPRKLSANGSNRLRPIEIDDSALYVQARGTIVRDLKPVASSAYFGSYEGTDLTVFAQHLFDGFTLNDWDFAHNPHSIVWAARSDGVLLGLTYMRDQALWGWHRHDTDGFIENVCVVGEGSVDTLYMIVKRTINGVTKRYIERMVPRFYLNPQDAHFVDCATVYNGWNTLATTVQISGGTLWDNTELLTLTASAPAFLAGDVGNQIIVQLTDVNGIELDRVVFTIGAFSSTTVVTGHVDKLIQASLRLARVTWAKAVKTLSGLSYLQGKSVSILGDGYVVASPNNTDAAYAPVVVTGGVITLAQPYAVIRVGLPYISDMQPLDLDLPGSGTIKDKKLLVNEVGLYMERSRGVWIGNPNSPTVANPVNGLREWKSRSDEPFGTPITERTDFFKVKIQNEWGPGRFLVRQVDPLPLAILSATPIGYLPQ